MDFALVAGAEDVRVDETLWEVFTTPDALYKVKGGIESKGKTVSSAAISFVPKNTIKVETDNAKTLLNLIDALEELDDTQHVYANFEMDDAVMEAVR